MNPKTCIMCGAHLEEKLTSYVEDLGGCIVIVRHRKKCSVLRLRAVRRDLLLSRRLQTPRRDPLRREDVHVRSDDHQLPPRRLIFQIKRPAPYANMRQASSRRRQHPLPV